MEKFSELQYEPINLKQFMTTIEILLNEFQNADNVKEQLHVFEEINIERNHVMTMFELCYARYTLNTKDEYYVAQMDYVDEIEPEIKGVESKIYKVILNSKFVKELEEEIGTLFFQKAKFAIKAFSEEVKKELVVENKLTSEYTKIMASAQIDYKGEVKNLSQMKPYMISKNRNERKEASEKYYGFLKDKQGELDRIYDELVKVRTSIAIKLGFKNFIELGYIRMYRLDYNEEMVANFRKQVLEDIVPISSELRKRQVKRLNLETLEYYDIDYMFKNGNPKPQGNHDWIVEQGKCMYQELSDETAEFYTMMIERELIDLVAKPGKSGGGYCMYLPDFKVPFVFSNFNGTEGDITVLTHEMGHAFQSYQSRWIKIPELCNPTYESAEIHSMSMEFLTYPWMERFFVQDTDKFKFFHMSDGILFIPYGVLVDHFQHYVYDNPTKTPSERRSMWRELEKMYLPAVTYNDNLYLENGGYWQKQSHIFEDPFYYIDYTLAQICAYQFYVKDLENHNDAWQDYMNLCSVGGSKPFLELLELANLKSPFEDGTVKDVMKIFDKKLKAIDDSKF